MREKKKTNKTLTKDENDFKKSSLSSQEMKTGRPLVEFFLEYLSRAFVDQRTRVGVGLRGRRSRGGGGQRRTYCPSGWLLNPRDVGTSGRRKAEPACGACFLLCQRSFQNAECRPRAAISKWYIIIIVSCAHEQPPTSEDDEFRRRFNVIGRRCSGDCCCSNAYRKSEYGRDARKANAVRPRLARRVPEWERERRGE